MASQLAEPEVSVSNHPEAVVVRFAGDSGDGMQLTGGQFTLSSALAGNDFATFSLQYPGGYPFYYPLELTCSGQRPLKIRIAPGFDFLQRFTRPDAEVRKYLGHYGYWRIEESVDPDEEDFWIQNLVH